MAADTTYPAGMLQRRQDGTADLPTGATFNLETGSVFASNGVDTGLGSVGFQRLTKIARVALAAVDTAGGVFSWVNPEAVDVIVTRVVIDVTTIATGACTLDVGQTPTSAATLSDNIIDGLDVHAATGSFGTGDGADANGKWQKHVAVGKWVTASTASGASAGIVGFAYIHYNLV